MAPAQGWHANSWSVPYFLSSSVQSINTIGPSATGPTRIAPWRAAGPFFTSNGHMFCAYQTNAALYPVKYENSSRSRQWTIAAPSAVRKSVVIGYHDAGRTKRQSRAHPQHWQRGMMLLSWIDDTFHPPPPSPSPPRSRPRFFFYSFCIYLGNKYADCVSVMLLWQHKRSHYSAGFVSSRGSHTIQ